MRHLGRSVLQKLFLGYLKLLEKTITIQWNTDTLCGSSQIFGFWHEDSFFMNLVLKELSKKTAPVDVIVTADVRGDYIENMIEHCGGHALRVPDGLACIGAVKSLMRQSYEEARSLAVSLDGPLGPRHEPKKLAFFLSEQRREDFVGIAVSYSACLRMFWRWDQYAVPLPFTKVTVDIRDYGEVNKRHVPELPVRAEAYRCVLQPAAEGAARDIPAELFADTGKGSAAGQLIMDMLRHEKGATE